MRATLRRSCDACAKSKQSCDLQLPRCSRCFKKDSACFYANEPLFSSRNRRAPFSKTSELNKQDINSENEVTSNGKRSTPDSVEKSVRLSGVADASFDPFDSYPPTRLPRLHVQRLIQYFLSNIAFRYYPLDLNIESNPFVVQWWPLALADPALFHVSLQTASLDEELRAQKGFPISELLMIDSVSLLRQKLEDSSLAFEDETMDSVVTLAAIEHGKGNVETSRAHINAVKQMVNVRGGISELKRTSPLTARMISWVSMLVTEAPQFQIQDDSGLGNGIAPTPQWRLALTGSDLQHLSLHDLKIDPTISNALVRLRTIFRHERVSHMTSTDLHDLACFVLHKLLLLSPLSSEIPEQSAVSECMRYAIALYMLSIHGTTYYSHDNLANDMILKLKRHIEALVGTDYMNSSAGIWVLSVGLVATTGTPYRKWFIAQTCTVAMALGLHTWEEVLVRLETVFWTRTQQEELVRRKWEEIFKLLTD
ncbi:hypothetical protein BGW36DRAFT_432534 [Talaromyces proteolyticus]|uniref:Zn(2)-C6 fungal-type domain-containing protein n=1 Tax=Talaromyces proteolyticus TaxID=1131652 RepID=A0AAD4PV14_9EURO|nr:uncharacterized protein BGW36DRAFT_432534 [Talaromyces proteolyticus]KAH8690744.1 hypothetical protein BGW36DRAFT_432534 [Talaromyces proteolyticus]